MPGGIPWAGIGLYCVLVFVPLLAVAAIVVWLGWNGGDGGGTPS